MWILSIVINNDFQITNKNLYLWLFNQYALWSWIAEKNIFINQDRYNLVYVSNKLIIIPISVTNTWIKIIEIGARIKQVKKKWSFMLK